MQRLLCLALSAALVCLATTATGGVSGRVTGLHGKPLAGAIINAYALETSDVRAQRLVAGRTRAPLASVHSDSDGVFQLPTREAVVDLEVRVEGFAPSFLRTVDGERVALVLDPVRSRKGAVITEGAPVPGATLIWITNAGDGTTSGEIIVESGQDGSYEIPDPDLWATHLVVIHPGFALLDASPRMTYRPSSMIYELNRGAAITGTVVDTSGSPVAGATLSVDSWPLGSSTAEGTFFIPHAPKAWKELVARRGDLVGAVKAGSGPIVIHVQQGRALAGRIRNSRTGAPVAGAVVTVQSDRSASGSTAISDSGGNYAFPSLIPSRYSGYVIRTGYSLPADPQDGGAIDLRKSRSLRRDFDLPRQRRLVGRVEDEDRNAVAGAFVTFGTPAALSAHGPGHLGRIGPPPTTSMADGSFALSVPEGAWTAERGLDFQMPLTVLKEGYAAGRWEPGNRKGFPEEPVVVTLTRGIEVSGRTLTAQGEPVPDVAIAAVESSAFLRGRFSSEGLGAELSGGAWTKSGSDGRFAVRVHPAPHHLMFLKSGHSPKVVSGYDPRSGGSLDVVLDPASEIRGRVSRRNGRGLADVLVFVQQEPLITSTVRTESDGRFVIPDLAPGSHEIVFVREGAGGYATRTLQAPSSDVAIELEPVGELRGRVVDAKSRAPVSRFTVTVEPTSADHAMAEFWGGRGQEVNDAAGGFVLDDVPAGEVALTIRAEGYVARRLDGLSVSDDGETTDLEVALEDAVAIRGRVTAVDEEALSDVGISVIESDEDGRLSTESDEEGEYELKGVRPGATVTLSFQRPGFLSARKTVNTAETARLDAVLSRGLSVRGMVISDGMGVPHSSVSAISSVVGAEYQSAVTDGKGRFRIDGLVPGRYSIQARTQDGRQANLADVDVEHAGSLRLVLERPQTAILSGKVVGLPAEQTLVGMVSVQGEDAAEQAAFDAGGSFRMEQAPAGHVRVTAVAVSLQGSRSSTAKDLTLAPGSETEIVVEFPSGVVITGMVTRERTPLGGAEVAFRADGGQGAATARTDANGQYEIASIEPGAYQVAVSAPGVSFDTEYVVSAGGRFDIDVTGATLGGRTIDATSGAPIGGVEVSLWRLGGRENSPASSMTTNGRGEFASRSLREGRYRLLTSRSGFGQEMRDLELQRGAATDVSLELQPAEGISVNVVDARDGRPLEATIVVRDLARRIVANRAEDRGADGTTTISLASGQYLLSTSASGYGTVTLPVTAPTRGLRIGLTPGGTLVVLSERELRGRIRLVQPDGEEYVQCWCNGIADIEVNGRRTTIPNVTPGSYAVEIVDPLGATSMASSVVIREGQVSRVTIE